MRTRKPNLKQMAVDRDFAEAVAIGFDKVEKLAAEYQRAHLPGIQLQPLRELLKSAADLPRDRLLLLACRSGRRASRALFVLEDLGYKKIAGLRGGILAWRAAGLPVEVGEPARIPE